MRALIIAAGAGERFGELTKHKPKPLLDVSGQPLITWILKGLRRAGIKGAFITVGYKGELIKKELGSKHGDLKIEYIDNPYWEKGNLQSLLVAEPYLKESFILCMSDHLFEPRIVEELIEYKTDKTVLLGVDKKFQQTADDTKALVDENKNIKRIGKKILGNYVDTGFFKCTPKVFKYARKAATEGKFELGECMNLAAEAGDAEAYDINHKFWIDVDTEEELDTYYVRNYGLCFSRNQW